MSKSLKYVCMDVHKSTIVIIVLNALGQFEMQAIIKIETEAVRGFFRKLDGTVHVIFEECTQSAWLYELIKPRWSPKLSSATCASINREATTLMRPMLKILPSSCGSATSHRSTKATGSNANSKSWHATMRT